eukprot:scaffold131302_cov46-Prasinocladus_malaysianus.AAC.1
MPMAEENPDMLKYDVRLPYMLQNGHLIRAWCLPVNPDVERSGGSQGVIERLELPAAHVQRESIADVRLLVLPAVADGHRADHSEQRGFVHRQSDGAFLPAEISREHFSQLRGISHKPKTDSLAVEVVELFDYVVLC